MPYLLRPRLHFAGFFEADPPTANNAIEHYDITKFKPQYVKRSRTSSVSYGEYDPSGSGRFRVLECKVTRACYSDGRDAVEAADDPVIGMRVMDGSNRVFAKMADLDPLQQAVTQLFGLKIRIVASDGSGAGRVNILDADFVPSPFTDIWIRVKGASPAEPTIAAFYQSILAAPVTWGATQRSPFLAELHAASKGNPLSIKFNLDSYDPEWTRARFGTGRIVGTIGLAAPDEPRTFVIGRQLLPSRPSLQVNPLVAALDTVRKRIVLDFGNALPTASVRGPLADIGSLHLAIDNRPVGDVPPYAQQGFYESTAAIVEVPLSEGDWAVVKGAALGIVSSAEDAQTVLWQEAADGVYVRADDLVFRMSPGETAQTKVYATKFGGPLTRFEILTVADAENLNPHAGYSVQHPPDALRFEQNVTTDQDGVATLTLEARDPRAPRPYVDGQIYAIRPLAANGGATKKYDVISVRLWNAVPQIDEPTWYQDVLPIFQQYANLYPAMKSVIDLSNYDDVVANGSLLKLALNLAIEDPNHMPVSRDLSPARRDLILRWLGTTGNGGLPSLGSNPPQKPHPSGPKTPPVTGGKAAEIFHDDDPRQ